MNQVEKQQANILIVDDTPDNITVLRQLLTEHGYRTRPAINGDVALHVARNTPPDLILLDIMMPSMDGFEVCRRLKSDERTRDIPVIFLSALGETSDKIKAFTLGGVDYITKPFQSEEVLARVQAHVGLRQARQQLHAQNRQLQAEIAERQRMEDALSQSEQRYQQLVNVSPDAIFVFNLADQILFVNPSGLMLLHAATPQDVIGKSTLYFIHPEYHDLVLKYRQMGLTGQIGTASLEYTVIRCDGTLVDVSAVSTVFTYQGQPAIQVILRDISERKHAEISLRDREELFRGMFESHSAVMLLLDPDTGKIIKANRAASEYYGYSIEELQQMNVRQINEQLPPQELAQVLQSVKTERQKVFESRHRLANGALREVEIHSTRITVAGQTLIFPIIHDITERKKMETRVRESEEYYRNLVNLLPDGLTVIDLEGRFSFVSPYSFVIFGVPPELNMIGTSGLAWFEPDELARITERIRKIATYQPTSPTEYRMHKYDGSPMWVELSSAPLMDAQGRVTGIMSLIRDITARKQEQEALQQAKNAAESANRAKSVFLANMSHELRTPLNGILGYAQILNRDSELTPKQCDGLNVIEQSGNHLLGLINDILDLAKVEAGKVELVIDDVEVPSLLRGISDMIRLKVESKPIVFQLETDPALPQNIRADERRLRQILLNLLGNAVKFTERGTVKLRVCELREVQGFENAQTHTLRFEVTDTGVGIAPEDLKNLGEPFKQVGDDKYKAQGTGLGLAISRNLIRLMGGELRVTSEHGKGSTFSFDLSLLRTQPEHRGAAAATQKIIGIADAAPTIVVADDLAANRSMLAALLEPLGFHVLEASDGCAALALIAAHRPAAIIADLRMPNMDGLTLIHQVRQTPELRDVLILATSASVTEDDRRKSLTVGSQAFLPKPLVIEHLLEELRKGLGLTWRYQTAPPFVVKPVDEEILPPVDTLHALSTFVRRGDIMELRRQLKALIEHGTACAPFLDKLLSLAKGLELARLQETLTNAIEQAALPPRHNADADTMTPE